MRYTPSRHNIEVEAGNGQTLIYNSLTQALSVLDREEIELFRKLTADHERELSAEEAKMLDNLLFRSFLIPADVDETDLCQHLYSNNRFSEDSMILTIIPTLSCNFACDYCFQGANKRKGMMSDEVQDSIINLISAKADQLKRLNVTWFGGEPLLGYGVIEKLSDRIITLCESRGIAYTSMIITNGYLLTPQKAEQLYSRRVENVQITLDGSREHHDKQRFLKSSGEGTFDTIVGNIKAYSDAVPIKTSIRVNIDKRNREAIVDLIEQLAEAGLGHKRVALYFAPIESSTRACWCVADQTLVQQDFAELEWELHTLAQSKGLSSAALPYRMAGLCGATKTNGFVIVPDGGVHKCWETVSCPEKSIGRLQQDGQIISNELLEMWSEWSPFKHEECKQCAILPNCVGFCPYKFLYRSEFSGESCSAPCPPLKYNIKQKLLQFAQSKNMGG